MEGLGARWEHRVAGCLVSCYVPHSTPSHAPLPPHFWPHTPCHHTSQGEYYACALSNIYTFGPTFRAEYSFTARHLAEFWMIEPEMAFCDIYDDMQCAEDYVRYCCKFILDNCR